MIHIKEFILKIHAIMHYYIDGGLRWIMEYLCYSVSRYMWEGLQNTACYSSWSEGRCYICAHMHL